MDRSGITVHGTTVYLDARPTDTTMFELPCVDQAAGNLATRDEGGYGCSPARVAQWVGPSAQRSPRVEGLGEFVDDDIDNVLSLFGEFNDGTHGSAGRSTTRQLVALKTRVEDAVLYIFKLIR